MEMINPRKISTRYIFSCWNCGIDLDIEDILFANICQYCGRSQIFEIKIGVWEW